MSGGSLTTRRKQQEVEAAASTRPFAISTIGGFRLTCDGERVPLVNRKAQAILVYLAMRQGGSEGRERLAGLLWSETDETKARASLRQTIADLRGALAPFDASVLSAGRTDVEFNLARVKVDVTTILEELQADAVPQALLETKRLTEGFLAGFDDLDPAFRSWLAVQRQFLHEKLVHALEAAVRLERVSDWLRRCGTAIVNLDPTHEVGCRALIETHAREGDVAGALRVYRELWQLLEDEFDSEPSEVTQELVVAIKSGSFGERTARAGDGEGNAPPATQMEVRSEGPMRGPAGGRTPDPLLVLLIGEFDAAGVGTDRVGLVRSFRHELVASLVRFRDWTVIEASAPPVIDGTRPIYSIQATVLETTDLLEFVLTLKEVATGRYLWSESFSVDSGGWHQIHQKIIRRLSASLGVNLTEQRLNQIAAAPDISLRLYDRWLKGQSLSFNWRPGDEDEAEGIFRSLIEEAPAFAPAYSSLVQILNSRHLVYPGIYRLASRHCEAIELAKMAVQLDAMDSRTQLSLAWSYAMSGMFDRAVVNFELACDLNGNDPWTLASSALGLAYCDQLDIARQTADIALDVGLGLSPLHWAYQASIRFILEEYEQAATAAAKADYAVLYLGGWKVAAHALAGQQAEAEAEADRFMEVIRTNWFGEEEPTPAAASNWFLHCFPIASPATWTNLRRGLEAAGLRPPEECRFSDRPQRYLHPRMV